MATLAQEIAKIKTAKADLAQAIKDKGGALADGAKLADFDEAVKAIEVSTGSIDFYKCASVDTDTLTWSGYKVIVDSEGVWNFAETLTNGLKYDYITPKINSVYNAECTFMALGYKIGLLVPSNGLISYLRLKNDYSDVTGNYTPVITNGVFEERYNRSALRTSDGNYAEFTTKNLRSSSGALSIFCAVSGIYYSGWGGIMALGAGISSMFGLDNFNNQINGRIGRDWGQFGSLTTSSWDTLAMTRDSSGNYAMYLNKQKIAETTESSNIEVTMEYLTLGYCRGAHKGNIYISDCCVYDRVLSLEEIIDIHDAVLNPANN